MRAEQAHGYRTGLIDSTGKITAKQARSYGTTFYEAYSDATGARVEADEAAGTTVFAWTPDQPAQWAALPAGIGVVTDDPVAYLSWWRSVHC